MTCEFKSLSTVFQSNEDDEKLIMKAMCNITPFTVENISSRAGVELGAAWSAGQRLTHWATGAPILAIIQQSGPTLSAELNQ